jgi:hypothetical protein
MAAEKYKSKVVRIFLTAGPTIGPFIAAGCAAHLR